MAKLTSLLLLVLPYTVLAAKFPANWTKCPKTNNEQCLKEAIEVAVKDMVNGNKDLNVIPLDPLHFDRMELNQGGTSPVNINLTFYDMDIIALQRMKINSLKVDWDNYFIEIDLEILDGPATLVGDYTIEGKVLVLPIQGNGKSNITMENFSALATFKGSENIRNNKKYFKVDDCTIVIRTSRAHIYLGNLFDGVPNLGEQMNTFLNENWKEIIGELNGTISRGLGLGFQSIANNLFQKIPLTQLYT